MTSFLYISDSVSAPVPSSTTAAPTPHREPATSESYIWKHESTKFCFVGVNWHS